jgi:AcrR family transcriptional regulator
MEHSAGAPSSAAAPARSQLGGIKHARPGKPAGKSHGEGTFADGERHAEGHEQLSQIQSARIVAAMVDVAAQHGVGYATVARVVARSGVSRRTFYEQFLDREDCFLAAFDRALDRIAAVGAPAYSRPSRWAERVRCGLAALLQFLDDESALARLVVVEAFGAGPKVLERRRLGIAQVVAVVDREGRAAAKAGAAPPPLTGEGVIGGALSLIHARLAFPAPAAAAPLLELLNPLVSLIVSPYLGPAAARRELDRPLPDAIGETYGADRLDLGSHGAQSGDPLRELDMRLTYRTVRVLLAIGDLAEPGVHPSNRQVGDAAGMRDQGQVSKLLARLRQLGLIENAAEPQIKGEPNGWTLTPRGHQVRATVSV